MPARLDGSRPSVHLLQHAAAANLAHLEGALSLEENSVRAEDKVYWLPLLKKLESMRHPK